jgi:hypothetical protein
MNPPSNWNTPGFWTAAVGVAGILINLLGHTFTPDQQGLVAAWLGHVAQDVVDGISLAGVLIAAWHGVAQTRALNEAKATMRARERGFAVEFDR